MGLPIWEELNRVNVAVRSLNAKYQKTFKSNSKRKLDSVCELNESWPEIEDSQRFDRTLIVRDFEYLIRISTFAKWRGSERILFTVL